MRAMFFERFGETPVIATLPDPAPRPGGVVVKVAATGICRSDWHGWQGHDPDIVLPHVPGHELAGTVAEVGRGVSRFKIGDRVTVPFVAACGACEECHSANHQVCRHQTQPGFTHWGSFAEYVALDYADTNLVALPEELDDATAASLGCRFATSFRAVIDQGRVKPGEWVSVHGCGGVGLSAVMIAAAAGAQVIAVDISDDKLAIARSVGAVASVDASGGADVAAAVREISGGGAHLSIDALGHPAVATSAILGLRRRGRHVQVGLLLAEHARAGLPMDRVVAWELEILGSHGMQAHRYPAMLEMIARGRLSPQKLINRHVSLEEAVGLMTSMDRSAETGINVITRF